MAGNAVTSNTVARRVARNTVFADIQSLVGASTSFNQGDLLVMDTTLHIVAKPAVQSDGQNFLGIAPVTVVNGKLPSVYTTATDASVGTPALPGPEFGDEVFVFLKSGDSLNPGDVVYLYPAGGAQYVQSVGNKSIGVYIGPAITAGASTQIIIKCGARYPGDTLKLG